MRIEPANVNQMREANNGRFVEIDKDIGEVAESLRRIDAGLSVRFAENGNPPYWVIFHEHHSDCPRNGDGGPGSTYLVTTAQAYQNRSGVWEGLDQRMVDRIREISHPSYDYVKALERHNAAVDRAKQQARSETFGEISELGAYALRKDLGARYKGRAFIGEKPDGV